MWSIASSTFSGSPVTVTQLGSGAPLCGKRMSTWKKQGQRALKDGLWTKVPPSHFFLVSEVFPSEFRKVLKFGFRALHLRKHLHHPARTTWFPEDKGC